MAHPQQPGGVDVGQAGMALVRHHTVAGPVAVALAVFEAANPWIIPHSTALIQNLMNAGVTYAVETLDELFWWARIRLVTQDLLAFTVLPIALGDSQSQRAWKGRHALIETQRAEYQRVGELDPAQHQQIFTFLGRQYALVRAGANHYYASRNGANIGYSGRLTDNGARSIIAMLNQQANHHAFDPTTLDDGAVDEFVCAYLAEPTRWPEEQVFNLLAIKNNPANQALTGNVGVILLPMASGTTWEQALGVVGAQIPRRIVAFARGAGLTAIIQQELAGAAALPAFLTAMRGQYGL